VTKIAFNLPDHAWMQINLNSEIRFQRSINCGVMVSDFQQHASTAEDFTAGISYLQFARLFAKLSRPGDSEVTFSSSSQGR